MMRNIATSCSSVKPCRSNVKLLVATDSGIPASCHPEPVARVPEPVARVTLSLSKGGRRACRRWQAGARPNREPVNRSVVAIVALVAFLCPQRGVQAAEPESDTWGNPFCAGMVDVIPWDRAANSPAKVITSDRFFVQLVADGKTNVAATITLITSSEAYSVAIP